MAEKSSYNGRRSYVRSSGVRHGRKRNALNVYAMIITAIIAALGALLSVNVFFNLSVTGLKINGSTLYEPEQIQSVAGLAPGQNLIRLNTDYIASRLEQTLVYIDDVKVEKDYPDNLVITITEATENAQIEQDGVYYTSSTSGKLLEVGQTERNEDLVLVVGYELKNTTAGASAESEDSQKTEALEEIFEQLKALEFEGIEQIDITDRTDIVLEYDGRIEIELGSSVDLDVKLSYIQAVIETGLPESYEGTLRYNGIDSGISAIPKEAEVTTAATTTVDSEADELTDDDSTADTYSEYDSSYYLDSEDTYTEDYTYSTDDYTYSTDDYTYTTDDYGNTTW